MDGKTWLGALAEAKVTAALIEQGFDVYRSLSGKAPFDLVAHKPGVLLRVEVKGCAREPIKGSYEVRLSSTRSNRTRNVIHRFDASKSDLLAVYLHAVGAVCFFRSNDFDGRRSISLRMSPNNTRDRLVSHLVHQYTSVPYDLGTQS